MVASPTGEIVDAIHAPVTSVTRRLAFYEADGVTPWRPDDDATETLLDGSISVDSTRDERRTLDLILDNTSGLFKRNPHDGFWYDKRIKVFRGVEYAARTRYADMILAENPQAYYRGGNSDVIRDLSIWGNHARKVGFPTVVAPLTKSPDTLGSVRFSDTVAYMKSDLLPDGHPAINWTKFTLEAWCRPVGNGGIYGGTIFGRKDFAVRIQVAADRRFQVLVHNTNGDYLVVVDPDFAVAGAVYHVAGTNDGANLKLFVNGELKAQIPMTYSLESGTTGFSIGGNGDSLQAMRGDVQEAVYFNRALSRDEIKRHYLAGLSGGRSRLTWDCQVGEFMIDGINEPRFPSNVKITGRDLTKRCLNPKLPVAMTFDADTPIETLIRAMAANAGITKFILPKTGIAVGEGADFDQGTPRWEVMKKISQTSAYDLFFDAEGFLVMRKQLDPATSTSRLTLQTGAKGNLVDWSKSSVDTEVFNRVICTSESSTDALPFYGEASNTDPTSPTSIKRLGERTWFYQSAFFTSNEQCAATAAQFLSVKGLESFSVDFSSLVFPWTEANEIIEFVDPGAPAYDPTKFLLSSFTIPLKLGPMTGTAKRITIVSSLGLG